jgi:hypothetical protein
VAGTECHAGSLIQRGHIAPAPARALQQLDAAGQVNLGSLHMAEFALSPTGYNGHHGHGLNPWQPAYACGGSACASAKYILKVAALQPLMSKRQTGNNNCADQRQCTAHVVCSVACEAFSLRLRQAWKVRACVSQNNPKCLSCVAAQRALGNVASQSMVQFQRCEGPSKFSPLRRWGNR